MGWPRLPLCWSRAWETPRTSEAVTIGCSCLLLLLLLVVVELEELVELARERPDQKQGEARIPFGRWVKRLKAFMVVGILDLPLEIDEIFT